MLDLVLTRSVSSAESLAATALRDFCSQKQLKERRKQHLRERNMIFFLGLIFSGPQSLCIRGVTEQQP